MNKKNLMICVFLSVVTLAIFWQVGNCDFNNVDDPVYVTENKGIQNGITLEGIRWAFTTNQAAYWHPLTWISHMLDIQLFGLNPRGHHVTNLLFHIANTVLLFLVLYRMTKAHWESAFVSALFALHPLHVESVAWVAERKDVLSTFFWMLTMGAYCYYVERPRLQRYLLVVVFFGLGLMAKPMLVTLPFVLLLLDYWPLQRFQQTQSNQKIRASENRLTSGTKQKRKLEKKHDVVKEARAEMPTHISVRWALIRPLFLEKIPLFALTVLSSMVIYSAQQKGGAVASFETFPLSARIANAFVSYIVYIGKTIWPSDLAVFYPYSLSLSKLQVFGAVLLFTLITILVIWMIKRAPYLAMGWLWYVGTLIPVIGLVQVGLQSRADRFTYIPLIGLFIMTTWGISEFYKNWRYRKVALFASSMVVLVCLSVVTWMQVRYWKNSITLIEHTLKVTENNYDAFFLLGIAYDKDLGDDRKASEAFKKAIEVLNKESEISPEQASIYYNRGNVYAALGNYGKAIKDYDKAIEIQPKYAAAHDSAGMAYVSLGNFQQAIINFNNAIEVNPKYAEAYYNRGNSYSRLDNYMQAIGDYDKAIAINSGYTEAYYHRGYAYWRLGNQRPAIEDLKIAARLGHENARDLLNKRGIGWSSR